MGPPFADRAKAAIQLGGQIAADRLKAHTAVHALVQRQSRRAYILGQASDPILAMASAPYGVPVNPLRFTNAPRAK